MEEEGRGRLAGKGSTAEEADLGGGGSQTRENRLRKYSDDRSLYPELRITKYCLLKRP